MDPKRINELTEGEMVTLFRWLEEDACTKVFFPLLLGRETDLTESLISKDCDKDRGGIREIRKIYGLHDQLIDMMEKVREEKETASATTS